MKTLIETHESEVRTYCRNWGHVFTTAKGEYINTIEGETYLDFFSGAGALNYGHNDPKMKLAIVNYIQQDGILHSLDMYTEAKYEFIREFENTVLQPRGLDYKFQFPGPTGTNAVEAALKLSRLYTGRKLIGTFTNSFHGMTLGSLAATSNPMKRDGAGVPLTHTVQYDYGDKYSQQSLDKIESDWLGKKNTPDLPAALILETVQGEGGVNAAPNDWLVEIAKLCQTFKVLLIIDDVQAGCGRTGSFFSFEQSGITPDIVCLSKSLSGMGIPFALTLIRPELDIWKPGQHNGTFRGNNLAFVTATTALREYWKDDAFQEQIHNRGTLLKTSVEELCKHYPGTAYTGRGMFVGIRFSDPLLAQQVAANAFANKLLVETSGLHDTVVKLMPALNIPNSSLAVGVQRIANAIAEAYQKTPSKRTITKSSTNTPTDQ